MANTPATTPSVQPTGAPEIESIKALQDKKADILVYLKNIPNLNDEEKQKLEDQYTQALDQLNGKTEDEKDRVLTGITEDISKLRGTIENEKQDTNEEQDELETDETTVVTEQKLVESEIRGRLDEFKASIEAKLANTEAQPSTPTEPEEVPEWVQTDIATAQEFFANKGVKLDTSEPVKWNWLQNIFNKILLSWYGMLEGWGVDVRNLKAKAEGYKNYESKQKVEETFKVLSQYMGDSLWEITNIADKEALVTKIEWLGLPLVAGWNILASPMMKFIFTGDEEALKDLPDDFDSKILHALRGKYLTLGDTPQTTASLNVLEKINLVFTLEAGKEQDYIERYKYDKEKRENNNQVPSEDAPAIEPATEEAAPEITTPLSEVLARYDGKAYTEENETTSNETIFTFEQDDTFLAIKRWGKREIANVNPNGTLTYRNITGTPEMIIQLARLDMYMNSFDWNLVLENKDNLTGENKIEKSFNDLDGQWMNNKIVTASIDELSPFLQNWDWQKLYTFLLRDEAQQIAPAEAAEMSGEKPQSVTQEDLDILMGRTDVKEDSVDAKFRGVLEEDGSITIIRTTADGDKSFNESIFPDTDGTYTVGNVRFPNITDAVKAANMRNWVRWYEDDGHELHVDWDSLQVNNGFFNDTSLIKDWKIPEFLSHGTLPETGNNITSLEEAYNFLKGAVIDDGVYGKNKTRKQWESEQITNS